MLGKGRGSKAPGAGFGTSSRASSVRWDRDLLSWRTCEPSLLEESTKFSGRWPTSGMMRSGALYGHPTWVPRIDASGSSSSHGWPTATVTGNHNVKGLSPTSGDGLATAAQNWATPRAEDGERGQGSKFDGLSEDVTAWATPTANEDAAGVSDGMQEMLTHQAKWFAGGKTPPPSEAPTAPSDSSPKAPRAGLNPRFGLWLMGFPTNWLDVEPPTRRR